MQVQQPISYSIDGFDAWNGGDLMREVWSCQDCSAADSDPVDLFVHSMMGTIMNEDLATIASTLHGVAAEFLKFSGKPRL